MLTTILVKGEPLHISDANCKQFDDLGNEWIPVKGPIKAHHYRVPAGLFDEIKAREVEEAAQMSVWHRKVQTGLQRLYPRGQQEFYGPGNERRADFKCGTRVFEVQYSEMSEDEPKERTDYWNEHGYKVTWILHHRLIEKYSPARMWHGEDFATANGYYKTLPRWFKPLIEWGNNIIFQLETYTFGYDVQKKKQLITSWRWDDIKNVSTDLKYEHEEQLCIYYFYRAKYNEKYNNYTIFGGCSKTLMHALVHGDGHRLYFPEFGGYR
tara:strand:- start:2456 stop:3256 length:801 start_codon:yes stop_codon:yes gene_type:complete